MSPMEVIFDLYPLDAMHECMNEPKVKVLIPMYEPLQIHRCEKCGKVIAEPKKLIRIQKGT